MSGSPPTAAGSIVPVRARIALCGLVLAFACSKDAGSGPQTIRETGYLACRVDAVGCSAAEFRCELDDRTSACVARPAACTDAPTCACAGEALCGDAVCRDVAGGIECTREVDMGPTGGDGSARPPVREDFEPDLQPFQAGLLFTRVDGEIQDGTFSVTGAVIASGFGASPDRVDLPLGDAHRTPLQAAWLRVADASTELVFAYALPWAVAAPAVGDTVTVEGHWNAQPSEFVQPMGFVTLRDAAGDLQLLVVSDFVPPEVPGISLGRGGFAGDLTLCGGPTHMYDIEAGAEGANVEVPYGGQSQVGPFVVLHGGLLEYTTECPEFSPRTTVALAGLRGRLAELEDAGAGPCGETACSTSEVCDAPACDRADPAAACNPAPPLTRCKAVPEPVCGCDGVPYESACVAAHRGASVSADTACLDACDGGMLTAGPCLRVWSCNGHDLGATCFRTAEEAAGALCECTIDGRIVDRVPYTAELCNDVDMRAACRFREF